MLGIEKRVLTAVGAALARNSSDRLVAGGAAGGGSQKGCFFSVAVRAQCVPTPAPALPEAAHYCLFLQVGGALRALVSSSGRYTRQFTLGAPAGAADFSFPEGYVCDWKNKEEFTLQEHMERLVGRRRDEIENIC